MSTLQLLGTADFQVSTKCLPSGGSKRSWRIFHTDESALAVAEVLIGILRSQKFEVSAARPEGRGSVWFRCGMDEHDAGISVLVGDKCGEVITVNITVCQLSKIGRHGVSSAVDVRWREVSEIIRTGVGEHFGTCGSFAWVGDIFQDFSRPKDQ